MSKKPFRATVIMTAIAVAACFIMIFVACSSESPVDASESDQAKPNEIVEIAIDDTSVEEDELDVKDESIVLTIKSDDKSTDRSYENVVTHTFTIINSETGEEARSSDGLLDFKSVATVITNYMTDHQYRTYAVGLVDNKFYIQQNVKEPVDYKLMTSIMTIQDTITVDDYFSITEAIYNDHKGYQADSLFRHSTSNGNRHYIVICEDNRAE